MRRSLPMAITAFIGFLVVFDFYLKIDVLQRWSQAFQNWGIIISAFALGIGAINLLRIHGRRVINRQPGFIESGILLISMIAIVFFGLAFGITSSQFLFLFTKMLQPLSAAIFSLLVFFIASASFRAFRARSLEAALLLGAGIILMLGRAPIGEMIWGRFPSIADWIMTVPNMAGNRGIMIGTAIGVVSVAIRVLLGIDRGYLGQE